MPVEIEDWMVAPGRDGFPAVCRWCNRIVVRQTELARASGGYGDDSAGWWSPAAGLYCTSMLDGSYIFRSPGSVSTSKHQPLIADLTNPSDVEWWLDH